MERRRESQSPWGRVPRLSGSKRDRARVGPHESPGRVLWRMLFWSTAAARTVRVLLPPSACHPLGGGARSLVPPPLTRPHPSLRWVLPMDLDTHLSGRPRHPHLLLLFTFLALHSTSALHLVSKIDTLRVHTPSSL